MPENKFPDPDNQNLLPHTISLFLTLAAFWLLNSGHYTLLILSLGLISIALVLTLPAGEYREELLVITYVIVVFSILVQGMTVGKLVKS